MVSTKEMTFDNYNESCLQNDHGLSKDDRISWKKALEYWPFFVTAISVRDYATAVCTICYNYCQIKEYIRSRNKLERPLRNEAVLYEARKMDFSDNEVIYLKQLYSTEVLDKKPDKNGKIKR